MALWVATPKVYIHALLNHNHTEIKIDSETTVKSASSDDCDIDSYNKPAYFNVFKFISSFIPSKEKSTTILTNKMVHFCSISFAVSLLRGPPVTV